MNERSIAARICMTVSVYLPLHATKSQALRTAIATAAVRHMTKALDSPLPCADDPARCELRIRKSARFGFSKIRWPFR